MVKWVFFCSMYWGIFSFNSIFFNNSSSYKRKSNLFCILNTLSLDNKRFLTSYWELISITTRPTTQMSNILHTVYIECVIIANREEHFRKPLLSVHSLKQVKWRCRRQQQHPYDIVCIWDYTYIKIDAFNHKVLHVSNLNSYTIHVRIWWNSVVL